MTANPPNNTDPPNQADSSPVGPQPPAGVPDANIPTEPWINRIHCGDALDLLSQMPAGFVDAVVTSPPYFQQREYPGQPRCQVGQEATPSAYVDRLVGIFAEVQRVLQETGTVWLVLGDKYLSGRLMGLPWRVAIALQDAGWILRSDIIWHKPNAMPSSARNRPTVDHEYVFFFTKSNGYYYDADAIREPHVTFTSQSRMRGGRRHFFLRDSTPESGKNGGQSNLHNGRWDQAFHPNGRNKRTVWSIPLSKFRDAHFAVFPERLVTTCILAGSPADGVVLDPFVGSGTTAVVAHQLKRSYIGIDAAEAYCQMARDRLANRRSADGGRRELA